jgi:hypothetical protein
LAAAAIAGLDASRSERAARPDGRRPRDRTMGIQTKRATGVYPVALFVRASRKRTALASRKQTRLKYHHNFTRRRMSHQLGRPNQKKTARQHRGATRRFF